MSIFNEEYSSVQVLPCLGALQFRLVSEGFFAYIASSDNWGKAGGIPHPNWSKDEWGTTNKVILITNGMGERDLGMVTVFCHPNQAKMETCDALSALCQCDSSEPNMVVVRRYLIYDKYTPR